MPCVLITGCDTGLGREFARQYAQAGFTVVATYRDLANRLPDEEATGATVRHFALDVTDFTQFDALKREVGAAPIDLLLSNAGIGLEQGQLGTLDYEYMRRIWAVNTLGPLKLVETFVDNVAASAQRRIVFISSRMGSITANLSGGHYGYRASKAALNAVGRSLAVDLYGRGITLNLLHPGGVNTAGGSATAELTAQESVSAMRTLITRLGNHETGQFSSYNGQLLPW
jgi:NAD(P)-dependent dehydrogenase (short-subunit alcohol dehydrogenase family)